MAKAAKVEAEELPTAYRLVPSASSFDFLEGAFSAAERTRKVGLAIVLASVTTLTLLILAGAGGMFSERASRDLLEQTQASNQAAVAKLAQIDTAGGVGVDEISAHVRERELALKGAVGHEIDVVGIIENLRTTAPAGVIIGQVTFAEKDPSDTTTSADTLGTITVTSTVSSFALIGSWTNAVATIPGVVDVVPSWTGGGTAIATTVTANVTKDALTPRAKALEKGKVK